jgi:hypothetical protein
MECDFASKTAKQNSVSDLETDGARWSDRQTTQRCAGKQHSRCQLGGVFHRRGALAWRVSRASSKRRKTSSALCSWMHSKETNAGNEQPRLDALPAQKV